MGRLVLYSCEVDLVAGAVWRDGIEEQTRINAVLLRLLRVMVQHAGQEVSHDLLRQQVWSDRLDLESPEDREQKTRTLYIAITRLRRAIYDEQRPYRHILAPRAGCYCFAPLLPAEVTEEDDCPLPRPVPTGGGDVLGDR